MSRFKVELVTMTDCVRFVAETNKVKGLVYLESGDGHFRVNAKSLLGAAASAEWTDLWVTSEEEIYSYVRDWIV